MPPKESLKIAGSFILGLLLLMGLPQMEWFAENLQRGQTALTAIALAITIAILLLGRKRVILAGPLALVFLLLAAIAIPSAIPARPVAQRNACIYNLGLIRDAKIQWAGANNKLAGAIPIEVDLCGTNGNTGILREMPTCPRGGTYKIGDVGQNPSCSLSNKGHRLE